MTFHDEMGLNAIFQEDIIFNLDSSQKGTLTIEKIAMARAGVLLDYPFFGYILGRMKIISTVEERVKKYVVSGLSLYFNTNYVQSQIENNINWKERLKGDLIHLVLHLIYNHNHRKIDRNTKLWAFAADIIVFQVMIELSVKSELGYEWEIPSFNQIPEELLKLPTEKVYELLINALDETEQSSKQSKDPDDSNNKDELGGIIHVALNSLNSSNSNKNLDPSNFNRNLCDMENLPEIQNRSSDIETNNDLIQGILRNAYEKSKQRGEIPGDIKIYLENEFEAKINWRSKLANYLQKTISVDTTWRIPNKRLIDHGYYFPSTFRENIRLLIAIDTSGSIEKKVVQQFLSEIQMIMHQISNVKIIMVECDAEIQRITEYEYGENLNLRNYSGGGGTDFRPVFNLIEKLDIDLLIYFTDGFGKYPDRIIREIPILWVITTDYEVPFGSAINI